MAISGHRRRHARRARCEFSRSDELRVGNHVTITCYESTVFQLKHRGGPAPAVNEEATATGSQSRIPGASSLPQLINSRPAELCHISTGNRVRYAVQRRGDCVTLSKQAVFALGSRLALSRRTQSHGVRWVGVIAYAYRARARLLRDRRLWCG